MGVDQDRIRRKSRTDEGTQELQPPEETSPEELALQQGVLPPRRPRGDQETEAVIPEEHGEVRPEPSGTAGIARGTRDLRDVTRADEEEDRGQATTEYAANADPDEAGGSPSR